MPKPKQPYIRTRDLFQGEDVLTSAELEAAGKILGEPVPNSGLLAIIVEDRETARLDKTYGGYVFHKPERGGDCKCSSCTMVRGKYEAIGQRLDSIVWQSITGEPAISLPFQLTYSGSTEQRRLYEEIRAEAREKSLEAGDPDLITEACALSDRCRAGEGLVNFARATAILAQCKRILEEHQQVAC